MSDKIIKTANKGEWAEFYTYLKILVDKMIVKGDNKLNPDPNVTYPVLTIIKNLINGDIKKISITKEGFSYTQDDNTLLQFKDEIISSKITKIFERILVGTDNPEGYSLSQEISLPIKNQLRTKTDITLHIEDPHTLTQQILGFSIKSKLTSQPSLINASPATKFTFLIEGSISDSDIEEINSIIGGRKIRDRIKSMTNKG
jgi:HpaII restriction endonuclease